MPKIKIIPEAKKPYIPKDSGLNELQPRFRPPGGKPPLPMDKSYNKQCREGR